MISSSDFPCYVSIYTQEKVDPLKSGLNLDELKYFLNINEYMDWLVDSAVEMPNEVQDSEEFLEWAREFQS